MLSEGSFRNASLGRCSLQALLLPVPSSPSWKFGSECWAFMGWLSMLVKGVIRTRDDSCPHRRSGSFFSRGQLVTWTGICSAPFSPCLCLFFDLLMKEASVEILLSTWGWWLSHSTAESIHLSRLVKPCGGLPLPSGPVWWENRITNEIPIPGFSLFLPSLLEIVTAHKLYVYLCLSAFVGLSLGGWCQGL